jgi:molybdopterin synthase catalytic subunit
VKVSVQKEDFDLSAEVRAISRGANVGAVASFVGLVREVRMTLEHYPGMTERAIRQIVEQAASRWQVMDCSVIHRYGELQPNDQIVMVAVASAHRGDAFAACEFIMDYLKTQAPFWKKEHRQAGAAWVEARAADDAGKSRPFGLAAGAPQARAAPGRRLKSRGRCSRAPRRRSATSSPRSKASGRRFPTSRRRRRKGCFARCGARPAALQYRLTAPSRAQRPPGCRRSTQRASPACAS